jgi:FkbM family methyltransferase
MTAPSSTASCHALLSHLWSRVLFKFILPRLHYAQIQGIKLDVSGLSSFMKNHIRTGRYEVQERLLAQRCLTKDDVILELGGAIGFIGLFCRQVIGVRTHLSVEANPHTLGWLKRNYALNGLQPLVIHAAAADQDGTLELDAGGEFWENSLVSAKSARQTVTVPARGLRHLIDAMPLPPTALICDIEGAEAYLDFQVLPRSVTKIIIELHPSVSGEATVTRLLNEFTQLGFAASAREGDTWLLTRPSHQNQA